MDAGKLIYDMLKCVLSIYFGISVIEYWVLRIIFNYPYIERIYKYLCYRVML